MKFWLIHAVLSILSQNDVYTYLKTIKNVHIAQNVIDGPQ